MDQKTQFSALPEGVDAEQWFADLRKRIQAEETLKQDLKPEEERKMNDGFAVEEMTKTQGWEIVADILSHMPMANIDPRGMGAEEWKFAQLNAFWQGNVAKELLDAIYGLIDEAHQLQRKKLGETKGAQKMRF